MSISIGHNGDGKRAAAFTEINITPLTDIFLVLLIMMMVLAPMFQNSNSAIKIPSIHSGESVSENKVIVEVTKDGHFFINTQKTAPDGLSSALHGLLSKSTNKMVVVRADKATPSSDVLKVFNAASQAGFQRLTIAAKPLSGGRSTQLENGSAKPQGKP